ncbi:Gfo/Idh/MocA family protein [Bradyrhizobium sp. 195]|uniref:Gfo/Idh/MocA family protein n=1 Tax=Bradyrhizobium sp. 195 TaxID=2782662 RepID=UPI00200064AF|nr:Gfo/Idh/MocA family oxidoreductase [Bradyrhizobium sp. 195]UPK28278.1 hypothetical protein IVB26_07440 [Bradyrhizobium sp. 195]
MKSEFDHIVIGSGSGGSVVASRLSDDPNLSVVGLLAVCTSSCGRLGRVLHIEGNFSAPQGLHFAPEDWRAHQSETPAGGMTLMGIHVLDAMIGLAGPIAGVRARSRKQFLQIDMDDTTDAQIEFASGCTGYLSTVTATARNWRLQVFGTTGWAEMHGYQQLTFAPVGQDTETTRFDAVDTERAELEAFAKFVLNRTEYPIPIDDVVRGIGALEAIFKSVREDRFVTVDSERGRLVDPL